jgi:hypothetical protein
MLYGKEELPITFMDSKSAQRRFNFILFFNLSIAKAVL